MRVKDVVSGLSSLLLVGCAAQQEMPVPVPEYQFTDAKTLCAGLEGKHGLRVIDVNPSPATDLVICTSPEMQGGMLEVSFVDGTGLPDVKNFPIEGTSRLIFASHAGKDADYVFYIVYLLSDFEESRNGCVPDVEEVGVWSCTLAPFGRDL